MGFPIKPATIFATRFTPSLVLSAFVQATAVLREVAGRRLVFEVAVTEPDGPVANAVIVRAVVPRARFGGWAGSQATSDDRG